MRLHTVFWLETVKSLIKAIISGLITCYNTVPLYSVVFDTVVRQKQNIKHEKNQFNKISPPCHFEMP